MLRANLSNAKESAIETVSDAAIKCKHEWFIVILRTKM